MKNFHLNYVKKYNGRLSILFLHANASSLESFKYQFSDESLKDYTLWAVDLPGHGDSAKAENPSEVYSIKSMGDIIAEFINQNISQPVVIVGSSLGGNIAIEASSKIKNLKGLFLCGTAPLSRLEDLGEAFLPHPSNAFSFLDEPNEDQLNALYELAVGNFNQHYQLIKEDIKRSDNNFRSTLLSNITQSLFSGEKEILSELSVPVAILQAENELVVNLEYLKKLKILNLWKNEIQLLNGAHHFMHLTHPNEFNILLNDFIKEVIR